MSSSDLSAKTNLRIPAGAIAGICSGIISLGIAYGVYSAKAEAQQDYNARIERRVDKLEEANGRVLEVIGRIDERTAYISKQLDGMKSQPSK